MKTSRFSIGFSFELKVIPQLLRQLRILTIMEYPHIYMNPEKITREDLSQDKR